MQVSSVKLNSDICLRILELLPVLEEPNVVSLSARLRVSSKRVQSHLKALSLIFAIHEVKPHPAGGGKPLYYLIDSALVDFFGGSFERKLETAIFTELLAKTSYQKDSRFHLSYYRSRVGSRVNFILELSPKLTIALKITGSEKVDARELLILDSLKTKLKRDQVECKGILLCGVEQGYAFKSKSTSLWVLPWESVF